ncbi:hypothetical protein PXH78_12230 [Mycolicibacterium smegmatis]|uniref:hypothetical protein n=1 Tax=Mycolicibacterium smegmatis TaxID=1772 RepID=UPI00138EF7A6|nr:hypothetical protein [Mycolicibacterium smegmatis]MDF1899790.1 hypothetical protein [Mycolicibacterium smegmatis]MDF1905578.1 hypothetical protein [Mycolicibacterium smegmatis]MDF1924621.1 hypothetical protein [Mycolicibacterium smegmatis]
MQHDSEVERAPDNHAVLLARYFADVVFVVAQQDPGLGSLGRVCERSYEVRYAGRVLVLVAPVAAVVVIDRCAADCACDTRFPDHIPEIAASLLYE